MFQCSGIHKNVKCIRGAVLGSKSLQVVFAVLAVHFMLKITGKWGRTAFISVAFILTVLMVGSLGYIVAYNNMDMGTSARLERSDDSQAGQAGSGDSSIDRLLQSVGQTSPQNQQPTLQPAVSRTTEASASNVWVVHEGAVLGPPKSEHVLEGIRYELIRELCEECGIAFNLRRDYTIGWLTSRRLC